jgi:crotonobetainyl-CoA:carnitine CoA-transferase CaiB-like acyl-CoA transferase
MLDRLVSDFAPHAPRPADAPKPLEGVCVIDFSHFLAGPFATMMLADMGADVIKIEAPGRGDEFRHYPPVPRETPAQGAPYMWSNRNKRSVALNLKHPEAVAIARELIAQADVLCENFSTGVMERFGLGYAEVKKINPKIVYCSVSAYGREGEFKDRLGFDPIAQAESGFISMNGYPDRQGVRTLSPVVDISTAMMVSNAILGALLARTRTGHGQQVEVALFDTAVLMTGYAAMQHVYTGDNPQRNGNTSPDTCPSGVFMSRDKPFYINCGNDKIFQRLALQVLDRPDLADDPVYADRNGRMARRDELFALLGDLFGSEPWSHWQPRMRAAQIPCGEVRSVGDALRSAEARDRKLVSRVPHPVLGWVPNIRLPIAYADTPLADPRPAPSVGEHTAEVLAEVLGYDRARITALRESGALAPPEAPVRPLAEPAAG